MEVAEIILVQDGKRPGGLRLGVVECALIQFRALDDPHAGKAGDTRAVTALRGGQDDGHPLAVPDREFLDHP